MGDDPIVTCSRCSGASISFTIRAGARWHCTMPHARACWCSRCQRERRSAARPSRGFWRCSHGRAANVSPCSRLSAMTRHGPSRSISRKRSQPQRKRRHRVPPPLPWKSLLRPSAQKRPRAPPEGARWWISANERPAAQRTACEERSRSSNHRPTPSAKGLKPTGTR